MIENSRILFGIVILIASEDRSGGGCFPFGFLLEKSNMLLLKFVMQDLGDEAGITGDQAGFDTGKSSFACE